MHKKKHRTQADVNKRAFKVAVARFTKICVTFATGMWIELCPQGLQGADQPGFTLSVAFACVPKTTHLEI